MSSINIRRAGLLALFSVLFISAPAFAFADSTNLVANPSLELGSAGNPDSWTQSNNMVPAATFSTSTPGHTGNSAAQIVANTYTSGEAKWDMTAVAVTAGQYYTFSDWYKSSTTTSVFIYYTGTCDDSITNASGGCWLSDVAPSANWNYFTTGFLSPVTGTIIIADDLAGAGTVTTDDYSLVEAATPPTFPTGTVTLTFDDGWQSFADNATSTLLANHLPATNYIITTELATDPDCSTLAATDYYLGCYMNTAEVQALKAEGFDIAAHTRNHLDLVKDPLNTAMLAEYNYANASALETGEINGSGTDLTGAGFTPADTFAYPYGSYNRAVEQLVHDANGGQFLAARSVDQGYNLENTDRYALKMQHVTNTTTAAQIESWINTALQNKTWLILMFHDVRAGTEAQGSLNPKCVGLADDAGNSYLDTNGNPLPTAPNPLPADTDCTTSQVLSDVAAYLAADPTRLAAVKNMQQVVTNWPDTVAPVIVLNGGLTVTVPAAVGTYTDPGFFSVTDNKDVTPTGTVTSAITSFNGTATTTLSFPINTSVVGTYVVNYSVKDAAGNTGSTTRTVIVAPTSPVAVSSTVTTLKNAPVGVTLTATDVENKPLTIATTTNPGHGTLVASSTAANVYTYTPAAGFIGSDLFTFKANDGTLDSNIATVTITVNDLPAPVISAQTVGTPDSSSVTITWTTDHPSTSRVVYDTVSHTDASTTEASTTPNFGYANSTTEDATLVTSHSVTVTGLSASTLYYFRTISHGSPSAFGAEASTTTAAAPVVVTPPSGGGSSGGGGGGGGGGGYVIIPTTAATTTGTVLGTSTVATVNITATSTSLVTCYVFTKSLSIGSNNADVTALQNLLNAKGYLSVQATGYFGMITSGAVSKYQAANGIQQTGTVGPKTRAALNVCTTSVTTTVTTAAANAPAGGNQFTTDLSLGSSGAGVTALQNKLLLEGVYSGPITGTFGPLTKAGVKAYQTKYSLPSTGYVGPMTRAQLNK